MDYTHDIFTFHIKPEDQQKLAEINSKIEALQPKPCDMCQYYNRPGWVWNAHQWVKCWQCNPTKPTR